MGLAVTTVIQPWLFAGFVPLQIMVVGLVLAGIGLVLRSRIPLAAATVPLLLAHYRFWQFPETGMILNGVLLIAVTLAAAAVAIELLKRREAGPRRLFDCRSPAGQSLPASTTPAPCSLGERPGIFTAALLSAARTAATPVEPPETANAARPATWGAAIDVPE